MGGKEEQENDSGVDFFIPVRVSSKFQILKLTVVCCSF